MKLTDIESVQLTTEDSSVETISVSIPGIGADTIGYIINAGNHILRNPLYVTYFFKTKEWVVFTENSYHKVSRSFIKTLLNKETISGAPIYSSIMQEGIYMT
jgi:hypothetical protein